MEEMNNFENISSSAEQQLPEQDGFAEDAVRIQGLVNSGVLNPQQGQYYMSQLAKKSLESKKCVNNGIYSADYMSECGN